METDTTETETTSPPKAETFDIPDYRAAGVRAAIIKLVRKAEKLGCSPPVVEEGEPFGVNRMDGYDAFGQPTTRWEVYVPFKLLAHAPVKLDGWSFEGVIVHGSDEEGKNLNVIRAVPGIELPKQYRTDPPTCDHCKAARRRYETFVVRHETKGVRRVGRNCLADYLGGKTAEWILHDATIVVALRCALEDGMDSGGGWGGASRRGLLGVLVMAAAVVRAQGWLSRKAAAEKGQDWATADSVGKYLDSPRDPKDPAPGITDQDVKDAEETIEWVRGIDPNTDSDYLHNLRAVFCQGCVGDKELGIVVSAVPVYQREREKRLWQAKWEATPSAFLGTVGVRFGGAKKGSPPALTARIVRRRTFEGSFGVTTAVTLIGEDAQGQTGDLIWYASGELPAALSLGAKVRVVGSVKKQELDKYTKRLTTYLTRADIEAIKEE